jgi:hypothetical protein
MPAVGPKRGFRSTRLTISAQDRQLGDGGFNQPSIVAVISQTNSSNREAPAYLVEDQRIAVGVLDGGRTDHDPRGKSLWSRVSTSDQGMEIPTTVSHASAPHATNSWVL